MSNTSAKDTISYLNGVTLRAIDEIEQLLLNLPQAGSQCEIQFVRAHNPTNQRGTADVINPGSLCVKDFPKPLTLSPRKSKSSSSSRDSSRTSSSTRSSQNSENPIEYRTITSIIESVQGPNSEMKELTTELNTKLKYKVLTDKIRISPIAEISGVVLEIDVEITISEEEKKILKLEIECPDYVPSRIKFGGKWRRIV